MPACLLAFLAKTEKAKGLININTIQMVFAVIPTVVDVDDRPSAMFRSCSVVVRVAVGVATDAVIAIAVVAVEIVVVFRATVGSDGVRQR